VEGVLYPTFREAAQEIGILENDASCRESMAEARVYAMPGALRILFGTLLVFCEPSDVRAIWNENLEEMTQDFKHAGVANQFLEGKALQALNGFLEQHSRSIKEYDLPAIPDILNAEDSYTARLILKHSSIPFSQKDLDNIKDLNQCQKEAFDKINNRVLEKQQGLFFIDGPGGTGKTFLYKCLLAASRQRNDIALATASSGIAAINLPGGRTAHSTFKIPLSVDAASTCSFKKQSPIAALLRETKVIIWDEAPMTHRHVFEALDRSLRDTMDSNLPFGGKTIILGGDFRQVMPVTAHASRAQIVASSITRSNLWRYFTKLHLTENMRAVGSNLEFRNFLLAVGEGRVPTMLDNMIEIPKSMSLPWDMKKEDDENLKSLIDKIYPNLGQDGLTMDIGNRGILATRNDTVDYVNNLILNSFPGQEHTYYSFDGVVDDTQNLYQVEFLNQLTPTSLPPHRLTLKKEAPVICLRNLDPANGICNGTRLICKTFERNVMEAEIAAGDHKGKRVFIPRIVLHTSDGFNMPFTLRRGQFPVRLAFALTINKAQGQTIPNVGVYLPESVFCHGQLYVALSRATSPEKISILVKPTTELEGGPWTRNIVYQEALTDSQLLPETHIVCYYQLPVRLVFLKHFNLFPLISISNINMFQQVVINVSNINMFQQIPHIKARPLSLYIPSSSNFHSLDSKITPS
jgi:hypothetical protein